MTKLKPMQLRHLCISVWNEYKSSSFFKTIWNLVWELYFVSLNSKFKVTYGQLGRQKCTFYLSNAHDNDLSTTRNVISEWNDNFGTYAFPNACPLQKAIKKTSLNSFWVRICATGRVISFAHAPTIGKQIVWEGLFSIQSWLNLTAMGNVSPLSGLCFWSVNQPITPAGVRSAVENCSAGSRLTLERLRCISYAWPCSTCIKNEW